MKRIKQSAEKQQGGMWFKDPREQIRAGQTCELKTCQTLVKREKYEKYVWINAGAAFFTLRVRSSVAHTHRKANPQKLQ